jgi:hypothetical protein
MNLGKWRRRPFRQECHANRRVAVSADGEYV